ncbi:MAG: alkaline phosphatase family protein, partial [Halobacteriota archaeon]
MTTRDAATELRRDLEEDGYVRPDYAGRSIANLPDSVAAILDAPADRPLPSSILAPAVEAREAPIEHVVLVVVDGFGWDRFVELRDGMAPLSRLAERATVSPLTSTYPSETAAAMITLYTGLQPIEHGQLGWFSFFPAVDVVGLSLPFTTRSGTPLDEAHGIDRSALFETAVRRTVGERLREAGVRTHHVAPAAIVDSPSSRQVDPSTRRVGYETVDGGFEAVADAL